MSSKLKIGDVVQWKPTMGYKGDPAYGEITKIRNVDYSEEQLECDVCWYKQKDVHCYLSGRLIYIAPKCSSLLKLVGVCR